MTGVAGDQIIGREKSYLEGRWQSQRDYYSKKSASYKKWAQGIQLFIAITAVLVPVLLNVPGIDKIVPTILSGLIAVAAAVENVYHFGDNWRSFRQTLEALKRERVLYDTCVAPYNNPNTSFEVFVQRCEAVIGQETSQYFEKDQEQN